MRSLPPLFPAAALVPVLLTADAFPAGAQEANLGASCVQYPQPPALEDGWPTTAPEDLGLSCETLEAMTAAIERGDYRNVHAVLIAKDGRLVYEEYFAGTDRRPENRGDTVTLAFDRNTLHTTRSAGKSFTSALVGVALVSGAIPSVEEPVLDFFPELIDRVDAGARAITIEHVLTMSAGLEWNEGEVPYTDPTNDERRLDQSTTPAEFVLGRPLTSEPGSRWNYSSGLPVLLGLIIHRTTGQSFGAYAREHLFDPLGIQRVEWTGPRAWADHPAFVWEGDEPWGRAAQPAGSLWLRPRDMLKFGAVYLSGGRWDGRQVLPADWVAASLRPHVPITGWERVEYPNGVVRHSAYGYQWWHNRLELPYGVVTLHWASGNGGQRIWVVPELGLTAVHLAGNYDVPRHGWEAERLLLERIVPWAMDIPAVYRHQAGLEPIAVEASEWPAPELPPAAADRYTGMYMEDEQRVEIRVLEGRLQLLPPVGMGPVDLIPRGDHTFTLGAVDGGIVREFYAPDERLVFVFDDQGRATHYEIRAPEGVRSFGERIR